MQNKEKYFNTCKVLWFKLIYFESFLGPFLDFEQMLSSGCSFSFFFPLCCFFLHLYLSVCEYIDSWNYFYNFSVGTMESSQFCRSNFLKICWYIVFFFQFTSSVQLIYMYFFLCGFSFMNIYDSQDSRGRGRLSL